MREWIPISTSPKGRLALAAVREFGSRPFDEVTVGQLATTADVTTGAIYHHFGSKLGLYTFVRADVERRLIDRMEGAVLAGGGHRGGASADTASVSTASVSAAAVSAAISAAVSTALLVGFDFAVSQGFLHLVGPPPAETEHDHLAEMLAVATSPASPVLGPILAAGWRAAVAAVAQGAEPRVARSALSLLDFRVPAERA